MHRIVVPALMLASVLVATGCGGGKEDRGLRYMPDMAESPAKKSQEAWRSPPVVAEDGTLVSAAIDVPAMLDPVPQSVPRNFNPYDIPDTVEGLEEAKLLVNPIVASEEVLRRGQDRFDIYCAVCHGKDGQVANSYVTGEGRVQGVVSITTPAVNAMPDGQIYHIITHGRGRMPDYSAQLLPEDRWAVIHYLRALYQATSAKGEELKALEQREAEGAAERFRPLPIPVPDYDRQRWPDKIRREEAE